MKRLITLFCAVSLLLVCFSGMTAFASEGGGKEPSNVNITVVMPEVAPTPAPEEPKPPAPTLITMFPVDVTEVRDGDNWQITKTYELNANEKPEDIPQANFERGSWTFTLTDILRKESANAETREYTETITLNTDTKDLEKILPLLAQTMEYRADDGFVGILSLDVSSIKVETAGTKTSSYTMSVTREYPRLSANDTSLVPKTIEEKGKTYTLAGVDWRAGNYSTVDYDQVPEYYTAVATYTATGSSTKVTGYTTSAVYSGTLAKLTQGKTVYTAYFIGEEIRTPLEIVPPTSVESAPAEPTPSESADETAADETEVEPTIEPTAEPTETPQDNGSTNPITMWLVVIPCMAIAAGGTYYFMKRKEKHDEKTLNPDSVADDDGGDDDSGISG